MADQMGGYTLPEIMKNNAPIASRDKYAIEEMSQNRHYIDSIESDNELAVLFDKLEADENCEE